jgi:hypothetical protein
MALRCCCALGLQKAVGFVRTTPGIKARGRARRFVNEVTFVDRPAGYTEIRKNTDGQK